MVLAGYGEGDTEKVSQGMLLQADEILEACSRKYYSRRDCHVPYGTGAFYWVTRVEAQDAADIKLLLGAVIWLLDAGRDADARFIVKYVEENYHCKVGEKPTTSNLENLSVRCGRRYDLMSAQERQMAAIPSPT
tara:strand:- start:34 stop:435 length:402 start_codon:yes stop_codon:yes gene_type:complete